MTMPDTSRCLNPPTTNRRRSTLYAPIISDRARCTRTRSEAKIDRGPPGRLERSHRHAIADPNGLSRLDAGWETGPRPSDRQNHRLRLQDQRGVKQGQEDGIMEAVQ